MPKRHQERLEIAEFLETLEDTTLYTNQSHTKCFISLKTIFEENATVAPEEVKRILSIFTNCLKDDINHCLPHAISAINSLMKNVTVSPNLTVQDLLPSALALLHIIKTLCVPTDTKKLRELSFELFLSYPEEVLNTMVLYNCSEILEIFHVYVTGGINVNQQLCEFLHKLLTLLSPEQKKQFVNEGIPVWLKDFVPSAMTVFSDVEDVHSHLIYLNCLETLVDILVDLEYFEIPVWQETLQCICNNQKYPLIMKNLLENGSDIWHRVWILFVKILKTQITHNCGNFGTPINSMLSVVELAFKMDVPTRCRAFQCWNSLIDNFSRETNYICLPKRIKLLLIPLKLNNARVEETALAKFNTWWNLIKKFDYKLDTLKEEVLISFIHFILGKEATAKKLGFVGAGVTYNSVRELSLQAFAQLVGHLDCDYCTALPKLDRKMFNNKLLTSNWNDIMFGLKTTIMMSLDDTGSKNIKFEPTEMNMSPITCVWKSFFIAIVELPPNNLRRDMFDGLFQILIDVTENCHKKTSFSDILFALTISLIKDDVKIKDALATYTEDEKPLLYKIILIITKPGMRKVFKGCDPEKVVQMLKPLTNLIVETKTVHWVLDNLPLVGTSVKVWVALLHSINDMEIVLCPELMYKLLEWPLKSINNINMDKYASIEWCKAYNLCFGTMNKNGLQTKIIQCITTNEENFVKRYFILCLTICLLKIQLIDGRSEDAGCLPEVLQNLTSRMHDYKEFEEVVPILIDTIVLMINNVTINENEQLARLALNCVKNILKMFIAELKLDEPEVNITTYKSLLSSSNQTVTPLNDNICTVLTTLFKAVDRLFKFPLYSDANCDFVNELREQASSLSQESPIYKFIMTKMKSLNCSVETVKNRINDSIEMLEELKKKDKNHISGDTRKNLKEFTSPDNAKVVKRSKAKEARIVNTVMENGEEYVVVKSNWKFNPRKLTENQKEKLQKKREDIPALYQDLSQSQDEFRLRSWKTNSQDAPSSNSKSENSSTTNDAVYILKNISNSDVVPNIMENILSKNDNNNPSELKPNSVKDNECDLLSNKPEQLSLSHKKNTKSPRMALKDRVFQNVRNLIENSTLKSNIKEIQATSQCQTENVPKTPKTKLRHDSNFTKTAPPLISTDRPSRMKRAPKKFNDVELFGIKKRRRSMTDCNSDLCDDSGIINLNESKTHNIDSDITADKAIVQIETNINPEVTKRIDVNEIDENVEAVPNVELEVTSLMQPEATKATFNEPSTENLCEYQGNDCAKDVQKKVGAQDDHTTDKNEASKKVDNVTIIKDCEIENSKFESIILNTPVSKPNEITQKSTAKKSGKKKSRIENELAIDMVEGHPFLKEKTSLKTSEKRLTRQKLLETESTNKRKSVTSKKTETITTPKLDKKLKETNKFLSNTQESSITVEQTQERLGSLELDSIIDDAPHSEDVIESSQDSTLTTISVKSTKRTSKRLPVVTVTRLQDISKFSITGTQDLLQDSCCEILSVTNKSVNQESKDDTELPRNKTAELEKNQLELTENMDTELADEDISDDVIIGKYDGSPTTVSIQPPIMVNVVENRAGPETQLAEADTQPNDPADFVQFESTNSSPNKLDILNTPMDIAENIPTTENGPISTPQTQDDIEIVSEPNESLTTGTDKCIDFDTDVSSPFKDDTQRKQDFLNNTLEISPIKAQSPDREKTSPVKESEETSTDYLVVKLSTPVQSNGEPFDKSGSPEFFTEDKTSPDKRDQSPPRVEATTSNGSPSSSLSLKKNRPQALRPIGRGAHMLGLCVPDSMNAIKNPERFETEDLKKGNTSTPARRNLRVVYNAVGDNRDYADEIAVQDNFLKFKKALPSTDSSPCVPILKRKHVDIADDNTASPATKRKRVSFQDPPVSTTVSVQKYLEPGCTISPSSAHKKLERVTLRLNSKPPRRLENTFVKLDTVLSKAVESFTEEQANSLTNDTNASLDVTPAVEVVNTSELNDTDPICPDLVNCKDSIENIAVELSSPAMKDLFIKELKEKVSTVGDLAKMTELEVNRLCIKAPKIQIAKKVLTDYVNKTAANVQGVDTPETINLADDTALATEMSEDMSESELKTACIGIQTNGSSICDAEVQTCTEIAKMVSTNSHACVQTVELGSKSSSEDISSCLSMRKDFADTLSEQLEETSTKKIAEKLPADAIIIDYHAMTSDESNLKLILNSIPLYCLGSNREGQKVPKDEKISNELSIVKDFLCDRFDSKDLIMFCSRLLEKVYNKDAS